MTNRIDIQNICTTPLPVSEQQLQYWADTVLKQHNEGAEITLRLVDENEMTSLNHQYRQQDKSTNVLAFPANLPAVVELELPFLGDVILCPAVLSRESAEQNKALADHWAHIVVHGILHLLGYDHIKEDDEAVMQAQEIAILLKFNINNPY